MKLFTNAFLLSILLAFSLQNLNAQDSDKSVTITTTGTGKTLDEAKQSCLRSAIEQAFGAFISSKIELLDDQIISDQITSVASGNIKSFEILNESQLPDGNWGVTVKVYVAVSKLTNFVQAKGISVEIKGGLFALNIKQQILNEEGEVMAVNQMVGLLHEFMQLAFDYTIISLNPHSLDSENKNWAIPLEITAKANKNMDFCADYFIKTLAALSLSPDDVDNYKSLNKNVYTINITYQDKIFHYYLRKRMSIKAINTFTENWEFYIRSFKVQSAMGESVSKGVGNIHEFWSGRPWFLKNWGDSEEFFKDLNKGRIFFLTDGNIAGKFNFEDTLTLQQIEQMSGYMIKPTGVTSQIKNGGFVVYDTPETILIAAIYDIDKKNWYESLKSCNELVLNGYNDWHLPSKNELMAIYSNLAIRKIGNFSPSLYYSSDKYINEKIDEENIYAVSFGRGEDQITPGHAWRCSQSSYRSSRPVRIYKKNPYKNMETTKGFNQKSLNNNNAIKSDVPYFGSATSIVERAYFYEEPDLSTKRKAYLVLNESVNYDKIMGDFIYVIFTNAEGRVTKGWLLKSDFEFKVK